MAHRPLTLAGVFAHPDDERETLARAREAEERAASVAETAWRALSEHRTQAADVTYRLVGHQEGWRAVFARSTFIRVHPAPRPGDPPEASLPEGLAKDGSGG